MPQRESVVYIIGAGFSAPLGVPTISDFYHRSADQYFSDTAKYAHFEKVFALVRDFSYAKNYYDASLLNIEELLSLAEIREHVGGASQIADVVRRYIKDVIEHHTPTIHQPFADRPSWPHSVFDAKQEYADYGSFVASIFGLRFSPVHGGRGLVARFEGEAPHYSIVSFNYDRVLESVAERLSEKCDCDVRFGATSTDGARRASLYKLHGCISDNGKSIIAPTWNKSTFLQDERVLNDWKGAFAALQQANHVRFVGYSLAEGDAYARYLLKASVIGTQNLKSIDVICRDSTGEVQRRYRSMITFDRFRFYNADIGEYLRNVTRHVKHVQTGPERYVPSLEEAHAQFVAERK